MIAKFENGGGAPVGAPESTGSKGGSTLLILGLLAVGAYLIYNYTKKKDDESTNK